MTKKDFEVIASHIKAQHDEQVKSCGSVGTMALYDLAARFANSFEDSNPRFDRRKFFAACGF